VGCTNNDPYATDNDGIFVVGRTFHLSDVQDGTSNTLFVGELTGDAPGSPKGWYWVRNNFCSVRYGINGLGTIPGEGISKVYAQGIETGFSSYHPGGCHFMMGDSSVQFLSHDINAAVLNALATRAGGEPIIAAF
jgi:hypothetical protein